MSLEAFSHPVTPATTQLYPWSSSLLFAYPEMERTPSQPALQLFSLAGQSVLITGASRGKFCLCSTFPASPQANDTLCSTPRRDAAASERCHPSSTLCTALTATTSFRSCLFSCVCPTSPHLANLLYAARFLSFPFLSLSFSPARHPRRTHADLHTAPAGIGQACAVALAEAGADICLVQRPGSSTSTSTHDQIAALGRRVEVVECDLADLESVKGVFPQAVEKMGGEIHVLVNCGGIQRRAPAVDFPEADWDEVRIFGVFSYKRA